MPGVQFIYSIFEVGTLNEYLCVDSQNKARQAVQMPMDRKTSAFEFSTSDGGYNPRGNAADAATMRTVSVDLIVIYEASLGRDNFTKCWREFETKVGHGRNCSIQFVDSDGVRVWTGYGHCIHFDKNLATDGISFCRIPFKMLLISPALRANQKTGVLVADNGLVADSGLFADTDPDTFAITATSMDHFITNVGSYPDRAPIIKLTGGTTGITGPIAIYNLSIVSVNGQFYGIYYNGSIAPNEVVTFDAGAFDVYSSIGTVDAYSQFGVYGSVPDGEWFRIDPDSNHIHMDFTAVSSGSFANIDWRDTTV